ncbi:hypothetical protein [Streptomyces sp. NBC_01465]|uniref:hypothetical protein n=1 Tax=Streptomyces sp. NBC_01465 TaxID=2903878 RepID=UPI002E359C00|nr:hypothetical protein [Streptomyces sp. NBC_01465]
MYLAQSWLDTSLKTIPIAAATTVILGAILAPWIARRQEAGRAQAAAEAQLRAIVTELRADVMYARTGLDTSNTYDPTPFSGFRLAAFTIRVVEGARNLPSRRQQKVAAALVELVGSWRLEFAEDIGAAWASRQGEYAHTNMIDSTRLHREEEQVTVLFAYNKRALENGDENNGLLGQMEKSQLPHEDHPQAVAAVDRLLDAVGGRHRLGSR